jgi:NADH-quinone oxidoreductase subunit C
MPEPVIDVLRQAFPGAAFEPGTATDMPTIEVERDRIVDVCRHLRDDPALQFVLLLEVTAVDRLPAEPRFEIVYHLACIGAAYAQPGGAAPARRLRLKVRLAGDDARLPSVVPVFPGANWLEREVFDLFGITFEGHPDLRRLLMPEDWEGYPLRKDYAVQIRKDATSWEPVQLSIEEFTQAIRAERERAERASGPAARPAARPEGSDDTGSARRD